MGRRASIAGTSSCSSVSCGVHSSICTVGLVCGSGALAVWKLLGDRSSDDNWRFIHLSYYLVA